MTNAASAARAQGRGLSGVEVLVKWGERTLERAFVDGRQRQAFRLGGEGCDFYAHPRWLGARAVSIVAFEDGEAVVHGGFTLDRLNEMKWEFGPLSVEARWAEASKMKVAPLGERVDYLQMNIFIAVAAVALMGIGGAIGYGIEHGEDDAAGGPVAPRLIKMVVNAEKKPKAVKVQEVAAVDSGGPKAPRPEGASGQPSPHRKAGRAAAGTSDEEEARAAIARMFGGKSMTGITGGTGLGNALTNALGGMEKSTACAGASCNGLGILGNGDGGGGLERDLGSLGLRTQGRNTPGYGRGPGLKKLGTGLIPDCLKDANGKCIDTTPGITTTETIICGEPGKGEGLGCLDKELIRKVIKANLAGVRACYQHELTRTPALEGKVSVKFTIGLEGNVPSSSLAHSTVGNTPLEQCVVDRMRVLQFPRSRGVAVVTYPFIFHQAGK
jgi:hypothetical protein